MSLKDEQRLWYEATTWDDIYIDLDHEDNHVLITVAGADTTCARMPKAQFDQMIFALYDRITGNEPWE